MTNTFFQFNSWILCIELPINFLGSFFPSLNFCNSSLALMCLLRHNITSRENMRLVTIKEVYLSFLKKNFKFLQFLCLTCIELRWGATFRAFSYTSMPCANTDKKRLKVYSLVFLPKAFCPASLPAKTWNTLYQEENQYLLWQWISYLYRMLPPYGQKFPGEKMLRNPIFSGWLTLTTILKIPVTASP